MKTEQEVLNALKILKETCIDNDDCDTCFLRDKYNACALFNVDTPSEWILKEESVPRLILD